MSVSRSEMGPVVVETAHEIQQPWQPLEMVYYGESMEVLVRADCDFLESLSALQSKKNFLRMSTEGHQ